MSLRQAIVKGMSNSAHLQDLHVPITMYFSCFISKQFSFNVSALNVSVVTQVNEKLPFFFGMGAGERSGWWHQVSTGTCAGRAILRQALLDGAQKCSRLEQAGKYPTRQTSVRYLVELICGTAAAACLNASAKQSFRSSSWFLPLYVRVRKRHSKIKPTQKDLVKDKVASNDFMIQWTVENNAIAKSISCLIAAV